MEHYRIKETSDSTFILEPISTVAHLNLVIDYLDGKTDIYNGHYDNTIIKWNSLWDEMKWLGYNPQTSRGIQKYINEQLS